MQPAPPSLETQLKQSARACEAAAVALAHSLRRADGGHGAAAAVKDTYREADSFAITVGAVMDEAAPMLPLLASDSRCIGRAPGLVKGSICNGFDTIAVVLVKLFDTAVDAILDVAGNQTRWLMSPLQAKACFEKMVTHHGQLRALYGIVHLAGKIVAHVDVEQSLFVDVAGAGSHPELEPGKWRSAIKMDDFYGRHFGFHYAPEMRNVLRVVNIARGSVWKSHAIDDPSASPLVRNMSMLGWGWVYSNMVLMNNLGLNIGGVSQIGADDAEGGMGIQALRKFMNLVEEPLVAGVSGLTSIDVAVDSSFEIPPPGEAGGVPAVDVAQHDEGVRGVLGDVVGPVHARLMSLKQRPLRLPKRREKRGVEVKVKGGKEVEVEASVVLEGKVAEKSIKEGMLRTEASVPDGPIAAVVEGIEKGSEKIGAPNANAMSAKLHSRGRMVGDEKPTALPVKVNAEKFREAQREKKVASGFEAKLSEGPQKSYLANTLKTEFSRLQSNVSSMLGLEEATPASGLVMHFHGGGFVSQSSEGHAVYMKEWCADIPDAVVLSIDYKLAPEYKYPVALDECVYAYLWALRNAELLGTMCDRIVFAGDSAGGNLAVATALKAREIGIRPPDGICLAYPALYVNVAWSPSRLLSFFDPLLPLSVLELCVKSYLPANDLQAGRTDALLSPTMASKEALLALPEIAMVCGSLDPLLDDAVLFAHRLHAAGRRNDELVVYESMPHGFLNMNQVNEAARDGMRYMAKKMAGYLELEMGRGGWVWKENVKNANAAAAVFDG